MTIVSRAVPFAIATLLAISTPALAQPAPGLQTMTVDRLGQILQSELRTLEGEDGRWQFQIGERTVIVLADAGSDRMRVFSPVISVDALTGPQVQAMLAANFHTALDARYAVTDGTVVAVYVHPLSTLQGDNFRSALRQVVSLAETFGTSYSSNELNFGLGQRQRPRGVEEI